MSGRSTLIIPTTTYAEIRATEMMVVGAWVRKSRHGDGITFGCFCKGVYASVRLRKGLDSNCRITVAHVDLSESICRIEW